jgi:hypothetical protein
MIIRFLLSFVVFLGLSLSARAADPFTIISVPVDATGDSAIEAQTLAIQQGQMQAATLVLERLTLASERSQNPLPEIDQETAAKMIRALEIANEKRSANRYLGDISVAFSPRDVQAYLKEAGLNMITSQARQRLVLPYSQGQLDTSSPWFQAWNTPKFSHALTPINLPKPEQISLIPRNSATVLSMSPGELADLGRSLGVQQILVTDGFNGVAGFDASTVDIALDTNQKQTIRVDRFALNGKSYEDAIVETMENDWKQNTVTLASEAVSMTVSVLYDSQAEWQRLKSAIDSSAQIQGARLDAMSKDGALMTVTYAGDLGRLQRELSFKGVDIREDETLGTILTRSGRR